MVQKSWRYCQRCGNKIPANEQGQPLEGVSVFQDNLGVQVELLVDKGCVREGETVYDILSVWQTQEASDGTGRPPEGGSKSGTSL